MTNKTSIKDIVKNDIRIAMMITFVWTVIGPNIQVLKGLLDPQTIAVFMLMATFSKELLGKLRKVTTFKTSTKIVIVYDAIFLIALIAIMFTGIGDRVLILSIMTLTIPFYLFVANNEIKLSGFISKNYKSYAVELIGTRLEIVKGRVMIAALVLNWLLGIFGIGINGMIVVFIVVSTIQTIYSIYNYRKYYKHLE